MSNDEPVASFASAGDLLGRLASGVTVLLQGSGPPWVADSPAETEAPLNNARAGTWGDLPLQTCVMLAPTLLSHAQDHVQAMSVLADAPDTVMASFSIVRSVLGSTAKVAYSLDPTASAEERLRRG